MGGHHALVLLALLVAAQLAAAAKPHPPAAAAALRRHAAGGGADKAGLDLLLRLHGEAAKQAYNACKDQHGEACQVPCRSMPGCAGCHPAGDGATVCAFAMPGHILSTDHKSSSPCPGGSISAGGRATSCQQCGAGLTTKGPAASACVAGQRKGASPRRGDRRVPAVDACLYFPCTNNTCFQSICRDNIDVGAPNSTAGRNCSCPDPGNPLLIASYYDDAYGCLLAPAKEPTLVAGLDSTCAVLVHPNAGKECSHQHDVPGHVNPSYSAPAAGRELPACAQVVLTNTPPVPGCDRNDATCLPADGGCWKQLEPSSSQPAWWAVGPSCTGGEAESFLGPCPSPACPRPPGYKTCRVAAANLTMRTAPCANAPAVQADGSDLVLESGASFTFNDLNSRQVSACEQYGLTPDDDALSTCWIQGTFKDASSGASYTGWVPSAYAFSNTTSGERAHFADPLCREAPDATAVVFNVESSASGSGPEGCNSPIDVGVSCFPGDATVQLRGSTQPVPMSQLRLGDEVAVRLADGLLGYEPVYAFGHRAAGVAAEFVELQLASREGSTWRLQATADHFVLTKGRRAGSVHKRAGAVLPGDVMWVAGDAQQQQQQLSEAVVVARRVILNAGLFAPLTLGGTVVVNGVLASVHSEWFADGLFATLGLPCSWLPHLYQAVLAPVRALWHHMPNYAHYYAMLESDADLATTVPSFTGLCLAVAKAVLHCTRDSAAAALAPASLALSGAALSAAVVLAFVATSHTTGGPNRPGTALAAKRPARLAAPLLLLALCVFVASASAADSTPPPAAKQQATAAPPTKQAAAQAGGRYGGWRGPDREYHGEEEGDYYQQQQQRRGYRQPPHNQQAPYEPDQGLEYPEYDQPSSGGYGSYGKAYECQGSPPAYLLPGGYWTCGHDNGYSHGGNEYNNEGSGSREYPMASSANYGSGNDGYCGGVCDTAVGYRGSPRAVCTRHGWRLVSGCTLGKVCTGLPMPDQPLMHGKWPDSCKNLAINKWCYAHCKEGYCNPDSIPAIYCDLDGWAMTVTPPEADCDRPE